MPGPTDAKEKPEAALVSEETGIVLNLFVKNAPVYPVFHTCINKPLYLCR